MDRVVLITSKELPSKEITMQRHGCFQYVAMLVVCAVGMCAAQTPKGAGSDLLGVVTDATGASLPRARILLINLATLETESAEALADGGFIFHNLKSAEYAVVIAGPLSSHSACWQSAIRQIKIAGTGAANLRVPLLLDNEKCQKVIE